MTQSKLGEEVGVGQNTVCQWETGERSPRADKLPELARVLGCTVDELFDGKEAREDERA